MCLLCTLVVNEDEILTLAQSFPYSIRIFVFGVGENVNKHFLRRLASVGHGLAEFAVGERVNFQKVSTTVIQSFLTQCRFQRSFTELGSQVSQISKLGGKMSNRSRWSTKLQTRSLPFTVETDNWFMVLWDSVYNQLYKELILKDTIFRTQFTLLSYVSLKEASFIRLLPRR